MAEFQIKKLLGGRNTAPVVGRPYKLKLTNKVICEKPLITFSLSNLRTDHIGSGNNKRGFRLFVAKCCPNRLSSHKYSFLGPVGAARMEGVGERIKRFSHANSLSLKAGAAL